MEDSTEEPQESVDEAQREAKQRIGELDDANEMEKRLEQNASDASEVDVPEPANDEQPGVDEDDIPSDEDERADEAGR